MQNANFKMQNSCKNIFNLIECLYCMPSTTTSKFWYVYVLLSQKDRKKYIGFTHDLKKRWAEHLEKRVFSTSYCHPLLLIYFEACLSEVYARRREGYLKTTGGRRFLSKRLKEYFSHNNLKL